MTYLTVLFALCFALIHVFVGKLRFLHSTPRSWWLSAAGGVAVSYVFLHLLPELGAHRDTFAEALGIGEEAAEAWVNLVALAGLGAFYGLERAAKVSRGTSARPRRAGRRGGGVFWLHIGSFALYNVLIGYLLLHREETGLAPLVFYFVAMALHFVTNDFGLREDHKARYDSQGRWVLAAAVLAGWAMGLAGEVSD
jgi:hypothetical protein